MHDINIKNQLEKIHIFEVNTDISRLSRNEQRALKKYIEECQIIHEVF